MTDATGRGARYELPATAWVDPLVIELLERYRLREWGVCASAATAGPHLARARDRAERAYAELVAAIAAGQRRGCV